MACIFGGFCTLQWFCLSQDSLTMEHELDSSKNESINSICIYCKYICIILRGNLLCVFIRAIWFKTSTLNNNTFFKILNFQIKTQNKRQNLEKLGRMKLLVY